MTPRTSNVIPPEKVKEVLVKAKANRERFEEEGWFTERNFPVEDLSHLDLPGWELAEGPVLWHRRYVWPARCRQ